MRSNIGATKPESGQDRVTSEEEETRMAFQLTEKYN
jgi:hypothetical protein